MLASFSECTSYEGWCDLLFGAPKAYGFSHVVFNVIKNRIVCPSQAVFITNHPSEWQDVYNSLQFYKIDPLVTHCRESYLPLLWSERNFQSPEQKVYYEEASRLGVRSGICLPIRGANGETGMLNFTSEELDRKVASQDTNITVGELLIFRDHLLESFFQLDSNRMGGPAKPKLTPRELECLKWIALGKTSWEVSRIICCAEVTVNYHVKNIMRKFDVQSRQHAVIRGLQAGIVSV